MKIPLQKRSSLRGEVEAIQQAITDKAFELFRGRGGAVGRALDDWLSAERDAIWRPAVELVERDGQFVVEAALAGVEARQIDLQVTAEELLIRADMSHAHPTDEQIHACEFRAGRLFRTIRFPQRIDPDKVQADYRNGLLRVHAPVARSHEARKVEITAT